MPNKKKIELIDSNSIYNGSFQILGTKFDTPARRVKTDSGEFLLNRYADRDSEHFNRIRDIVHKANQQWWLDPTTGQPKEFNVGEKLMLIVTELSEACEGDRKNLQDNHIPNRKMFELELTDAIIRIFDLAGRLNLDIGGAFVEKMVYNSIRADHKLENRAKPGGKKY